MGNSQVKSAFLKQECAQIILGFFVFRIYEYRFLETSQSPLSVSLFIQRQAETHVYIRLKGIDSQRFPVMNDGPVCLMFFCQRCP